MAKKKKRVGKVAGRKSPEALELHARVRRHMELTGEMRLLIAECTALRDDGKLAAARKVMRTIERLQSELLELHAVN